MLRGLNARGFAVVVLSAEEPDGTYYLDVEDVMAKAGWNFILNFEINSSPCFSHAHIIVFLKIETGTVTCPAYQLRRFHNLVLD